MVAFSFAEFARKVLDAAKKGGLSSADLKKLERLLIKDGKRNKILASGLVSAMKAGGAREIDKIGKIFERASERIEAGKPPFSEADAKSLRSILRDAGISEKTTAWVSRHIDELLANEIKEFIEGKTVRFGTVPSKKLEGEKKKLALR